MSITIVMAFQDRHEQLHKTLQTYTQSIYKDFNVVIIDDCSKEDIDQSGFDKLPFKIDVTKIKEKNWYNPCVVFNMGFNRALEYKPDIIMITSPECYHVGDVISYATTVTDKNYLSFACFKVNKDIADDIFTLIENNNHIIKYNQDGTWSESGAWGNHSVHDPIAINYACAITVGNLVKINGFDERFAHGVSFEDEYLVTQIKRLGLTINIIDYPFVVHQWHPSWMTIDRVPELWKVNSQVIHSIGEGEYRAKHFITPDL
jgi:hypothetical protein